MKIAINSRRLSELGKKPAAETCYGQHRLYTGQKEKRKGLTLSGKTICSSCGAMHYQKHWFMPSNLPESMSGKRSAKRGLCPGCQRIADETCEGEVIINHSMDADDIIGLIKHIEGRAWHSSPLSRIISITRAKNKMVVKTTTKRLAIALGKALYKSHKGDLEINARPGGEFAWVHWTSK